MRIFGLFGKAFQLRGQQRRLKLTQPVIKTNGSMVKFIRQAGAAGIDVGLHALMVFEVIGQHDAAFAGGDELARLEAEGPQVADRPRAFAPPLTAVGMGTVFDDLQ